jgi:hypothetical protein
MDTWTRDSFSGTVVAVGDAEWAVMQTVHFTASVLLEWWCATMATADQQISSRHRHAIRFENDRIHNYPKWVS